MSNEEITELVRQLRDALSLAVADMYGSKGFGVIVQAHEAADRWLYRQPKTTQLTQEEIDALFPFRWYGHVQGYGRRQESK